MNHYGISAIHWDADLGEIDEVLLHRLGRHERGDTFFFERGRRTSCSDVVGHIRRGDVVWVMQRTGQGRYINTDHVGINVKRGRQAYLYSCTKEGTPTPALTNLHRYQKPEDAPAQAVSANATSTVPSAAVSYGRGTR